LQQSGLDTEKLSVVGRDHHTDEHVAGAISKRTGDRFRRDERAHPRRTLTVARTWFVFYPIKNEFNQLNMKSKTVGLRVSSLIFGVVCLGHITRLCVRGGIVIDGHHFGLIPNLIFIIVTGGLAIWLAKLAGPWFAEMREPPTPRGGSDRNEPAGL
jgi:hypothetical protein